MMLKKEAKMPISEDDEDSQITNENGKRPNEDTNKSGKKRLKTKSLYRQPTVNELNRLQETETLFNSNLFRLQVEEVLQEVKVKEKTEKKFTEWFENFKKHLLTIPEDDKEYDLSENTLYKKLKIKLPVNKDLDKVKCVFKFHKFKDVQIVGSYGIKCSFNSELLIDLQIIVPAETYTKNDSINYRYHKKRAAYLAYIAAHLKKFKSIELLNFSTCYNQETTPTIFIKPADNLAKYFSVRLNLVCESDAYKLHRFSPQRNNLRESWLFEGKGGNTDTQNASEAGPPTPYYNSSVLSDLTAEENYQYLKDTLHNSDNLKQAIVLLKIWLRQRKLDVSGYVISMYVAFLVQSKRINNIMSSYQIVRNVWIALKNSEWDTKGITLHKENYSLPLEEIVKHFPVVFLDTTGYYNIIWNMCKGTYDALKRESSLAVEMLDNGNINSFIPLFMVPVTPLLQFDHIIKFKNLSKLKDAILSRAPTETRLNYGLDHLSLVTNTLHLLLSKGLGNRADLILQVVEADTTWSVNESLKKVKSKLNKESLSFGLILNPEHAMNIVERGPPANVPEAEAFRLFWGDKSELRRFQDGSITEACVWEAESTVHQRAISKQIVDYLMQLKYEIPSSEIHHVCGYLDTLLHRKQYLLECEEAAERAARAFGELTRDLRALTQLPLEVAAVYGTSAVFSYSDPVCPVPAGKPRNPWRRGDTAMIKEIVSEDGSILLPEYTPVCHAVLELGHSGKWPGDLEAFRCLKAAFHIQMADRLKQQFSLPAHPYPSHIDVLKNGLVFRLEIVHPKEITLLKREIVNGVVKYRESEESVNMQRDKVLLPRVRGALHGLQQKHSAYGPTACLFKRWLSSHLLSPPHWPEVLADLLSAAVFLLSYPLSPPQAPATGFLRVLRLLAETDWTTDMIVLDFNGDMKREEITDLENKLKERDMTTQPMAVATSYDGTLPAIWTAVAPSANVLARAQILAKSTLKFMEQALLCDLKDNVLSAFVPSLKGYDVLLHLDSCIVPHSAERVNHKPSPRVLPSAVADEVVPVVEFDPVQVYLEELRAAYSDFALFFHDRYGGDIIAVLWKPDIDQLRDFQISNPNALKPISSNGEKKYQVNKAALIEDFRILGSGIVRDVTVYN